MADAVEATSTGGSSESRPRFRWPTALRRAVAGCRRASATATPPGGPLVDEHAVAHDEDPVRQTGHDGEVVAHEQQRRPLAAETFEQIEDLVLDGDVEGRRRLVGDDQLGVTTDGRGDERPLAQSARELVRALVGPHLGVGHTDVGEELLARLALGTRHIRGWINSSATSLPTARSGSSETSASCRTSPISSPRSRATPARRARAGRRRRPQLVASTRACRPARPTRVRPVTLLPTPTPRRSPRTRRARGERDPFTASVTVEPLLKVTWRSSTVTSGVLTGSPRPDGGGRRGQLTVDDRQHVLEEPIELLPGGEGRHSQGHVAHADRTRSMISAITWSGWPKMPA